jgi:acyl carrier protein
MDANFIDATRWLETWLRANGAPDAALDESTDFVANGTIDSFGTIQLIAAAEERFGIRFDEDDFAAPEFVTMGGFARIVAARRAAR